MADPNIQSITFPVAYQGASTKYVAEINKTTGAMDVYEQTPLGNRYFILTSYPGNDWKPELASGALVPGNYSADQQKHILTTVSSAANNQRAAFVNKNYTATQRQQFAGMPKVNNTAPNPIPAAPGGGSSADPPKPDPQQTVPKGFEGVNIVEDFGGLKESAGSYNPNGKQAWVYPTGLANNKQDYIKFNMISYGPRKGITPTGSIGQRTFGGATDSQVAAGKTRDILGTVILPIQPSITDMNMVDWQNDTMNALQAAGASIALQASGSNASAAVEASIGQLVEKLGGDENIKQYLRYWAAGKAVGTNLFSRIAGATVNPNLELLFNAPQLRPFNFNFRLSPRSQEEANIVKGVIRFFKKGMSVSRRADNLFLKAPNVFEIQYINGQTGKPHNSINKIKICALTNCGVDYTPDGTYATFYDQESTMTSYGLTLQFNELEPVFNDDYDNNQTSIGY